MQWSLNKTENSPGRWPRGQRLRQNESGGWHRGILEDDWEASSRDQLLMEKTWPIWRLGQRLLMAEEVGLLWWLGREPEATWEETGLFWRHGQRLPLRRRPSADKGGSRLLGGLDGVWHPSPCQADMSRWLDRTTATVKIMEPLRQVDTASEASDWAGVPPFVQGRMSATACMEETLWKPAVTVIGHRSSSTGGRPPQRGVTGSGFGSDRAGLNTAGWAGPCGSDSTGLGRSGSDIDRLGLAWRDKCYWGIYSEANSHEPKHVHVKLWEM